MFQRPLISGYHNFVMKPVNMRSLRPSWCLITLTPLLCNSFSLQSVPTPTYVLKNGNIKLLTTDNQLHSLPVHANVVWTGKKEILILAAFVTWKFSADLTYVPWRSKTWTKPLLSPTRSLSLIRHKLIERKKWRRFQAIFGWHFLSLSFSLSSLALFSFLRLLC